ncbi:hypothetical protein [Solimonas sp. K1W22B-7]|uniref:hypothetical protein n=1 Tax=Solimonas sp. K1W22B-7 TaxID=2303331 RepID=UPI0013C49024|nr:hypothetical protein [Solimonas sp. K1W22B-7]
MKADPTQWSKQSQRSVAAGWTKEYTDIAYACWRCRKQDVFSAEDQHRTLCGQCWQEANDIRRSIEFSQRQWASAKSALRGDNVFLSGRLNLLVELEAYMPYKTDSAKKNMLLKLIKQNAQPALQADGPASGGPTA